MFDVIKAGLSVFQKGKAVANPAVWKSAAQATSMLVGLLSAVVGFLRVNGYDLPVTDETLTQLASGVVLLYFGGVGMYRVITDKNRGLPPKRLPTDSETNGECE